MSENEPLRCPKRSERHRRTRTKIKAWRLSRYLNPKYHLRKLIEDIKSAKAGLKMWHLDSATSENEMRKAIRGKLFATFLAGTPVAGLGAPIGYAIQVGTNNVMLGVILGVLIANFLGLVAFQVVWATSNREFYRRKYSHFGDRWRAMFHDIWPMQWKSVKIALMMNLFMLPLAWIVTIAISWLFPQGIRFVPISFVISATEAVFIQSTTIRLLGDLFERHSRALARRYAPTLSSTE